jgi:regulator of replication initiation timing
MIILLFIGSIGFSQSKKDLHEQVTALTAEKQKLMDDVLNLKQQIIDLKTEILDYKNENGKLQTELATRNTSSQNTSEAAIATQNVTNSQTSSGRCQAITAKGTQCTRSAEPGSKYCWQHKKTYEPASTSTSSSSNASKSSTNSSSSSYGGRVIQTGPRGGQYYINSHGNKTYIKKK